MIYRYISKRQSDFSTSRGIHFHACHAKFRKNKIAKISEFTVPNARFFVVRLDSGSDTQHQMEVKSKNKIPVVGLLVQGSPRSIDHVLFYVQNKMPIVVVKGSGGIADLSC